MSVPEQIINELRTAITSQQAAFCCGGAVPIVSGQDKPVETLDPQGEPTASPPVVLRWDVPNDTAIRKLTFPSHAGARATSAIDDLLKDSAPASFGRQGVDVLDETYRKAAKLDNTQFSTNFSPYEFGIVDSIAQVLLPGIAEPFTDGKTSFMDNLGVVAELYKLNIYSGPSGKFRAHVDTPRGATQFGSLVLCLPFAHEGGHLRVAHNGEEKRFDLSSGNANAIKWAAFYSDCEHEVLKVQGVLSTLHKVKNALKCPNFMKNGGTLGFYCTHAYAHSDKNSSIRLPFALKGVDMVIYAVFNSLGLEVSVRLVLEDIFYETKDKNPIHLVGRELWEMAFSDEGGFSDSDKIVKDCWGSDYFEDILWLNQPGPKAVAVAHLAYGNEPETEHHYSFASILVDVPSFRKRSLNLIADEEVEAPSAKKEEVHNDTDEESKLPSSKKEEFTLGTDKEVKGPPSKESKVARGTEGGIKVQSSEESTDALATNEEAKVPPSKKDKAVV